MLIFGVMGVINFAHGELYMMGAYAVVYLYAGQELPFLVGGRASGMVFVGCLGLLMETGAVPAAAGESARRADRLDRLPADPAERSPCSASACACRTCRPSPRSASIIGGAVLTYERLAGHRGDDRPARRCSGCSCARRGFGWALRAVSQDREAAALQGISINQTARYAMFIGAGLAGVAGALTAPLVAPTPYMGHSVIVTAFIIIIVGGIGSLEGAVIAAILYALRPHLRDDAL